MNCEKCEEKEEQFEECDRCGHYDVSWCMSSGCQEEEPVLPPVVVCCQCDKKIVRNSREHDYCCINDTGGVVCSDCVKNKLCECENCYDSEEEEPEYDTCQRCKDVVKVDYVTGEGYTIGDCDFTGRMLCRPCLDLMTKRHEIKKQNKMMKKGKFIIIEH